jgi:hypothetical protein
MAGISGESAERFSVFTAISFTRPFFTNPLSEGIAENTAATSPPTSAGIDCPVPLYGTCTMSSPLADFNTSMVRWWTLPMPDEPYEYLPGFALMSARNSSNVLTGSDGLIARKRGARAAIEMKVKSFCGS